MAKIAIYINAGIIGVDKKEQKLPQYRDLITSHLLSHLGTNHFYVLLSICYHLLLITDVIGTFR